MSSSSSSISSDFWLDYVLKRILIRRIKFLYSTLGARKNVYSSEIEIQNIRMSCQQVSNSTVQQFNSTILHSSTSIP